MEGWNGKIRERKELKLPCTKSKEPPVPKGRLKNTLLQCQGTKSGEWKIRM